jgi:hypothetical protein
MCVLLTLRVETSILSLFSMERSFRFLLAERWLNEAGREVSSQVGSVDNTKKREMKSKATRILIYWSIYVCDSSGHFCPGGRFVVCHIK